MLNRNRESREGEREGGVWMLRLINLLSNIKNYRRIWAAHADMHVPRSIKQEETLFVSYFFPPPLFFFF